MIPENIKQSTTLALHWTERVKCLSNGSSLMIHASGSEHYWYKQAVKSIHLLYCDMVDPNTAYQFRDNESAICSALANDVEYIIYRLQEMIMDSHGYTNSKIKDLFTMLEAMKRVSSFMLPIAVPIIIEPIPIPYNRIAFLEKFFLSFKNLFN